MTAAHQDIGTNPRQPFMSGDSRIIECAVKDEAGAAFDLTNATAIRWQLFASDGSAGFSGVAVLQKSLGSGVSSVSPATDGKFRVQLDPADTASLAGAYYHEAEVTMTGGAVHTVLTGKFQITADAIE